MRLKFDDLIVAGDHMFDTEIDSDFNLERKLVTLGAKH